MQKSDGSPVTDSEWRANRLVDALAQAAARTHRVPAALRDLLATADRLVDHTAALLGRVTYAANNYLETQCQPNGAYVQVVHRDAAPSPFELGKRCGGAAAYSRPPTGPVASSASSTAPAAAPPPPPAPPPAPTAPLPAALPRAPRRDQRAHKRAHDADLEDTQMRAWWHAMATRPRAPVQGPSADDRRAAVLQRIRAKAASATSA